MADLSPEAQAVLDAFNGYHELVNRRIKIAAALRAAANNVGYKWASLEVADYLNRIADELEDAS